MRITQNFTFLCAKLNDVMKLLSYLKDNHEQLAILIDGFVYDMDVLHPDLPNIRNNIEKGRRHDCKLSLRTQHFAKTKFRRMSRH